MLSQRQLARYQGRETGFVCPIEMLAVSDLKMDHCQRMLDKNHVSKLIRKNGGINWFKFQPLDVVRKSTGELTVINGQHRLEILRQILPQQETVQCRVIDSDDERLAAELFASFNAREIKRVKDTDLLYAEILAGDARALKILKALEQCDLQTGRVNEAPGRLTVELASFTKCIKWGLGETERAVKLYRQAWPRERSVNGDVLTGMVRLLTTDHYQQDLAESEPYGRDFDQWFVAVFQHLSLDRAKYTEYRNSQSGNWYDGVAWGLLVDFSESQLQKSRGYPSKTRMAEIHGNTRRVR